MLKKSLWLTIAVLAIACAVYFTHGNGFTSSKVNSPADANSVFPPGEWITLVPLNTATKSISATPTTTSTKIPTATATATKTAAPTKTATKTPVPTKTATLTSSPTNTSTTIPTATPTAIVTYQLQSGSPAYLLNFAHPAAGCNWQGVAGQIFDLKGAPITNYVVKINGTYNGKTVSLLGITGSSAAAPYGLHAYEIVLGNQSLESVNSLHIQIYNPYGVAVTKALKFNTYANCQKNLIIINFMR
jgi:hypothetical protein